ncbi:MAG: hypothetical protein ACLUIR_03710 [Faecalibacterium prausnitzii]
MERIAARDGISPEMAARRLNAQTPEAVLTARADYILPTPPPARRWRRRRTSCVICSSGRVPRLKSCSDCCAGWWCWPASRQ